MNAPALRVYTVLLLASCLTASVFAADTHVTVHGDQVSVDARNEPLSELMRAFSEAGILVRMDPELDTRVTARFPAIPIEEAIDRILGRMNYVLLWRTIAGPLGRIQKPSEVQIFKPGRKQDMRTVSAPTPHRQTNTALYEPDEVLVRFAGHVDAKRARELLRSLNAVITGSVPQLGIYRIRLVGDGDLAALREGLRRSGIVAKEEPNYLYRAPSPVGADLPLSNPKLLPSATRSDGVVAVMDSGLSATAGLSRVVHSFYDVPGQSTNWSDSAGHGTQMALVASGLVTPAGARGGTEVPVVAIRAFGDDGTANSYELMESIAYVLKSGANVVNMSWSAGASSSFLQEVLDVAAERDLLIVAAAGNVPLGTAVYPAGAESVLAVSAASTDGQIWDQSNYGSFVDLAAPGMASMPVGYKGEPGGYAGTSIASAYTASVLARLRANRPELSANQARDALLDAVRTHGTPAPRQGHGAGILTDAVINALFPQD